MQAHQPRFRYPHTSITAVLLLRRYYAMLCQACERAPVLGLYLLVCLIWSLVLYAVAYAIPQ